MKNVLILVLSAVLMGNLSAQSGEDKSSFTEKLYTMTTLVYVVDQNGRDSQATGFFFAKIDSVSGKVESTWLITNRHVLYPDEKFPKAMALHLRSVNGSKIEWVQLPMMESDIKNNLNLFADTAIDVAALNVTNLLGSAYKSRKDLAPTQALSVRDLVENSAYKPEVGEDILCVGYPLEFYDKYNKFPIVKTGIIASAYGTNFNDKPRFLIDCKPYPGSSGSMVIAKPKDVFVAGGQVKYRKDKALLLLGIYQGEPFEQFVEPGGATRTNTYNLGTVWYADLIKALLEIK